MKLKHILLILVTAPIFLASTLKHDYYVSVTKIEYSEDQKSLQIISQIFIDDVETMLRERYNEDLTLAPDNKPKEINDYINHYLSHKLKVSVNGEPMDFVFIGKEYEDDMVRCYLEIENVSNIKSLEVSNKVLFDILPEQQNIVRFKMLGENKSFLLIPDNASCVLNF